ncbi:uncharacterized protein LTR77_004087 [Saxophila tyrrhenica]|uniref:TATA-box-binding protein n=1 Tax=Saxophila tyrrhenica TaxID=1690608 RepID=A0AAV9PCI6_9PEZI|nr:hypothetical protein LTR77_004087 [Saxophila tyrrhenica]
MASPISLSSSSSTRRSSSRALPYDGPKLANIVCGVNLNCRFDLQLIARHCRNVEYCPKRFKAAIIRTREPKATALVFEGGKMQMLGARSVDDAKLACRKFARMLQKLGYEPRTEGFNVQNMVAHADTKMVVRLEGLHAENWRWTQFEPELFPGLFFQMMQPNMKTLVFAKGKVVLLGGKEEGDFEKAMQNLYPLLVQYRKT